MPTIIREDGFEVIIYSGNEHAPPHVHVFKAGDHLRVAIGDAETYPYPLGRGNTLTGKAGVVAIDLVKKHQATLAAAWRRIHG
ncbi:MAG: hypothetical protein JWM80_6611 [Cyanobacteria bacterium RYN_339]|nr:hypothetical protein [Cyanobacteria bacterium RYN_339]